MARKRTILSYAAEVRKSRRRADLISKMRPALAFLQENMAGCEKIANFFHTENHECSLLYYTTFMIFTQKIMNVV